ncbi:MAG: hypothetical protein HY922_01415 [Elusimicrobia bacterium]|nr:hypothetical protein [Elusimicrobiota bacterium]
MAEKSAFYESVKREVVAKLRHDPEAHIKAGPLVLGLICSELRRPGATTKLVLEDGCYGAMSGLVLIDKDVIAGAVEVLKAVVQVVQERSGDPMKTMGYALDGIARIASAVPPDKIAEMSSQIEATFMGAGQEFSDRAAKYR